MASFLKLIKTWFELWRAYLAEFLGTFIFVLLANGAILTNNFYEVGNLGVALASGLAIAAAVFATVHLSGAHLNPAVTLAMWLTKKVTGTVASAYIIGQVLGGVAASGLLLLIFGQGISELGFGVLALGIGINQQMGIMVEAIFTAILILTVFATMVDRRGPISFGPLAVGLVVTAAGIVAGPITGAMLNPARVVGPAVISGGWDNLAVWIVGPALGSLFGLVYDFLFLKKKK